MFKYWGFGLHIDSEIEFPELLPCDFAEADVTIKRGVAPAILIGADIIKRAFSFVGYDEYLLTIKNVCRYYVHKGSEIIFEPWNDIDERSIRLFLLGTAMAALLYQRNLIPLHASAIIKDGKLVVFAGTSGAGKSTLSAYTTSKGYDLFTDDICVLQNNIPGKPGLFGTASYPMLKLWENTINELNNDQFNKDFNVRPKLPKFGQFFFNTFITKPIPLGKIFILRSTGSIEKIEVNRLENISIFRQLILQSYRRQFINSPKLKVVQFSILSQIANEIPVYEVKRPLNGTSVEQLYKQIENII